MSSGKMQTAASKVFLAAITLALAAPAAMAQDYPAREIRSLCNFSAGSGADIIVRFYSDRLAKLAHQTDEYVSMDRIRQSVAIYAALIRDWCGT